MLRNPATPLLPDPCLPCILPPRAAAAAVRHTHTMASTPRTPTPAPERSPPPVPTPRPPPPVETPPRPPVPLPTPPPPLETPPPPSPSSSQPGDEYHTPAPSLTDGSPREEASFPSDGNGREGGAPPKSPQLSPMRFAAPPRLLPPPSPRTRAGQNGEEEEGSAKAKAAAAETAAPAQQPLRMTGLARSPSSQRSLVTTNSSPSPSPSPTPPSPLTPATPVVNSSGNNNNNNRSGQSTPRRAETKLPLPLPLSSPAAATATIAVHFNPAEEAVTSPLHLGGEARLDQHQQEQHSAAVAENGGSVPPDVAAVVAAGERRELSVTLRLATAMLSLAAFSVIASARTSGWAGDYYAHHLQYRYAVAVNVIVCAYSIAQSFGEIRRLISPNFMFRTMSSYYFSLFLDQALAYLLMSASSAAASRNDLWVSRFGTDAFNRKITSALWLSFIAFLMLALNALISTANLFSIA